MGTDVFVHIALHIICLKCINKKQVDYHSRNYMISTSIVWLTRGQNIQINLVSRFPEFF